MVTIMAQTSVRIMQCVSAKSGILKIDCIGVGVGIILHSQAKKIGAGIHVLAPHSASPDPPNPAKFADTAIPYAIDLIEKEGAAPPFKVAIAGGAAMTGTSTSSGIGTKVVDAVKDAMKKAGLSISVDQTGGSNIRSMILNIDTGEIQVS